VENNSVQSPWYGPFIVRVEKNPVSYTCLFATPLYGEILEKH
jgi:hypothetical protein